MTGDDVPNVLVQLANDYSKLAQTDKSIFYLQQAPRRKGRPDPHILNLLGIRYGDKEDWERQEKMYREAFAAAPDDPAPLFNLALSQLRRGLASEADTTIQTALKLDCQGPSHVLAAQIHQKLHRTQSAQSALEKSFQMFGPVSTMSDWELGWYRTAAQMAQDKARIDEAAAEQNRRKQRQPTGEGEGAGMLPDIAPVLQKL